MNKYVSLCISLLLLLSVAAYAEPEQSNAPLPMLNKASAKLPYVPNKVIVKLRQERLLTGKTPKSALDIKYKDRKDFDERTLSGIKARHRIKSHAPVFKSLHHELESKGMSLRQHIEDRNMRLKQQKGRVKEVREEADLFPFYVLDINKGDDAEQLCIELKKDPCVEYAQPDYAYTVNLLPNDTYHNQTGGADISWYPWNNLLWGIEKINCLTAWDNPASASLGEGVVVAVIDTGIDYTHEDLRENMWVNPGEVPGNGIDDDGNGYPDDIYGFDFRDSVDANADGDYLDPEDIADNDPSDEYMHGTFMAGVIAAVLNNGKGIYGVAPRARLMALKVHDRWGFSSTSAIAEALYYAAENGADVINNSYGPDGYRPYDPALEEAVLYACEQGCVLVFAAGNENHDVADYSPANMPEVITVAATDAQDQRCSWSNYGAGIDVAAPGYAIFSSIPMDFVAWAQRDMRENKYLRQSGTSISAAHVSGLCALMLARNGDLKQSDIEQAIRQNAAVIPPPDQPIGAGRIDALATLSNIPGIDHIAITRTVFANDQLKVYAIMRTPSPSPVTLSWKYSNSSTGETMGTVTPPAVNEEFLAGIIAHRGFNNRIINIKIQAGSLTNETSFCYSRVYGLEFINRLNQRVNLLGNDKYYLRATLLGTTWTNVTVDYKKTGDTSWQTAGVNVLYPSSDHDINGATVAEVDTGYISQAGDYTFRITAQASGGGTAYTAVATIPVEVNPTTMRGWPAYTRSYTDYELLAIDFDADKDLEICVHAPRWGGGGQYGMQVLQGDGRDDDNLFLYYPGDVSPWLSGYDLDGMLGDELLATNYGLRSIGLLKGTGGYRSSLPPWPKTFPTGEYPDSLSAPPFISDVDGDRMPEILMRTKTSDGPVDHLYAYRPNGEVIFNAQIPNNVMYNTGVNDPPKTLVTCDLNNDGTREVIVASQTDETTSVYLRAYRIDGSEYLQNNWPINLEGISTQTSTWKRDFQVLYSAVGDVDGDRDEEVIIINNLGEVFVLEKNGSVHPGWPKDVSGPEVGVYSGSADMVLADMDGDTHPEIITSRKDAINVFKSNGTQLSGWPKHILSLLPEYAWMYTKNCVVADINDDNEQEILIAAFAGKDTSSWAGRHFILALNNSGSIIQKWDLGESFDPRKISLAVADIDRDNTLELISTGIVPVPIGFSSDYRLCRVFVWKLEGSSGNSRLDWPMFRADAQRSATWFLQGDVKTDGEINVLDAQACINHFLAVQYWGKRADVNNDGSVDILDIQQLVNIILGV